MLTYLEPFSFEDFKNKDFIYLKNINEGFSKYFSSNLVLDEQGFKDFLAKSYENSTSEVFVDFYIKDLDDEAIANLLSLLDEENRAVLTSLLPLRDCDTAFFKICDKRVIPFLTILSTRELFFTSFYFREFTLWGNYGLSFPMFFRNEGNFKRLKEMNCN